MKRFWSGYVAQYTIKVLEDSVVSLGYLITFGSRM